MKVLCVVGTRPNFVKIAPIVAALRAHGDVQVRLVHTGQHYDVAMNARLFEQLRIPHPDVSLDVGSGTHAAQTAEIMRRFEPVLEAEDPDVVLVVGDVNSTLACALVAAKAQVAVVHVEAGLRSGDRTMPEEINRILTDRLSDRLYVTEASGMGNLRDEGIAAERIVFAGNVMIDTLFANRDRAVPAAETFAAAGRPGFAAGSGFALVTLHRPSNVDEPGQLAALLEALGALAAEIPVVFPMHPRSRDRIAALGRLSLFDGPAMLALPPVGYLEMVGLMSAARLVLTDSGGVQEETTALGVPCLTLRDNTERPVTVTQGTNRVIGRAPAALLGAAREALATPVQAARPDGWDGHAATRIAADLRAWLGAAAVAR
jgi:UDP-N-acetylglucosamine 2-epimerase (non-hydrolysing)